MEAHARNNEYRLAPHWATDMVDFIEKKNVQTLRIHAAGDFDTVSYIRKWDEIVSVCGNTTFYAYTRSWTQPQLLPRLVELSNYPNFEMWFSWDSSMPVPPEYEGIRTCYLSLNDEDQPVAPTDLVFREKASRHPYKTIVKFMEPYHSLVCPHEQGVERKIQMTCAQCGICFNKAKQPKQLVQLT